MISPAWNCLRRLFKCLWTAVSSNSTEKNILIKPLTALGFWDKCNKISQNINSDDIDNEFSVSTDSFFSLGYKF